MSAGDAASAASVRSVSVQPLRGDPFVRTLTYGVIFVIITIVCVVIYALLSGVTDPPAPRTRAEATLFSKGALVRERPSDGTAWADYAESLYATGDKAAAWQAIKDGRAKAKDSDTVRQINVAEVHLLILEGRDKEAVDKTTAYIQQDIDIRDEQAKKNFEKLIVVPYMMQNNAATVRMFVLRAMAQGNLGQWKDAVLSFDNALQFDAQAADIMVLRGYARIGAGDKTGARTDFETALKFLPDDASALEGLRRLGVK